MAETRFRDRVVAVILLLSVTVDCTPQLPPGMKICNRDSNELASCFKTAIPTAIKILAKGNENLGIPSLDPLHVDKLEISDGSPNAPLPFAITLTNVIAHYISELTLDTVEAEFNEKMNLKANTTLKRVRVEADYDVDGKVLTIQVKSKGHFTADITGLYAELVTESERFMKKGKEYMRPTLFQFQIPKLDSFVVSFKSSDGNKEIDSVLTNMVNQNWEDMWKIMAKPLVEALEYIFKESVKRIFERIPLDELMPKK